MTTYSIEKLSGSTDGKAIKVTGTNAAGMVTVHTATAGAGDIDLVTIMAINQNASGVTRSLVLAWGGTTDPDNLITVPIPAKVGPVTVVLEMPIMNAAVITAWADVANEVMLIGRVNRVDK